MSRGIRIGARRRVAMRLAGVAGGLTAIYAPSAAAYVDPGAGSIILQGLLAALAMIAVAGSMFWQRVKATFRRLFSRKKPQSGGTDEKKEPDRG